MWNKVVMIFLKVKVSPKWLKYLHLFLKKSSVVTQTVVTWLNTWSLNKALNYISFLNGLQVQILIMNMNNCTEHLSWTLSSLVSIETSWKSLPDTCGCVLVLNGLHTSCSSSWLVHIFPQDLFLFFISIRICETLPKEWAEAFGPGGSAAAARWTHLERCNLKDSCDFFH